MDNEDFGKEILLYKTAAGEELPVKTDGDNPRVFYAYDAGAVIWLLNGYFKKTMKIPSREIAKAESIKRRLGL